SGVAVEHVAIRVLAEAEPELQRAVARRGHGTHLLGPRPVGLRHASVRLDDLVRHRFIGRDERPVRRHPSASESRRGRDVQREGLVTGDDEFAAQFARWLSAQRGTDVVVDEIEHPSVGYSSVTTMLRARWHDNGHAEAARLVVRMAPSPAGTFADYDLAVQQA